MSKHGTLEIERLKKTLQKRGHDVDVKFSLLFIRRKTDKKN